MRGEHPFACHEGNGQFMAFREALRKLGEGDEMAYSRAGKDDYMKLWAFHPAESRLQAVLSTLVRKMIARFQTTKKQSLSVVHQFWWTLWKGIPSKKHDSSNLVLRVEESHEKECL